MPKLYPSLLCLSLCLMASHAYSQQNRPTVPVPSMVEEFEPEVITEEQAAQRPNVVSTSQSLPVDAVYQNAFPSSIDQPQTSARQPTFLDEVMKRWQPTQRFSVNPKESIMIPVGQGLMNTFSTNLSMLNAKTNDETSTYEIDEGYLYITVNTENPISLVLYEEGVLESQVSITLVPVPAPPTLVEIEFNLTDAMVIKAEDYRKEYELNERILSQSQPIQANNPYQQFISDLFLPVARGDITRGFALTPNIPDENRFPCAMSIYHETKQRLVSGKHVIDVVHVVNDSEKTYQVREEMCLGRYIKAVALFEKAYLQPGEESELYILRDKQAEEKESRRPRRPRLTGE